MVDRTYLETSIDEVGRVTLFLVKVDSPDNVSASAKAIDDTFAN